MKTVLYEENQRMKTKHHASKKVSVLLLGLSALVFTAFTSAHADLISGPFTTTTPIASTLTDWNGTLSFQQFNPSLGTLTSVELDLSSTLTTTLTVTNNSPTSSSYGNAKTDMYVSVKGPLNDAPQLEVLSQGFTYGTLLNQLGAGDSVVSGLLTKSGTSSNIYTLSSVLSAFTGTGSISLPASTATYTDIAVTGGNTFSSQVTNANLTGTVTYTYTPVPLPSALLLLGPGLLSLVGIKRRFLP
jgi:hypothetical protein